MSHKSISLLGISAVLLFLIALLIFGLLHPDFDFLTDYISKLGYKSTPRSFWWNLLGFGLTGMLLSVFGFYYGKILKDNLMGVLLALFGIGFAFTDFPFDMSNEHADVSKAHIAAITLGLASWLFGLARLGYNKQLAPQIRKRANIAAAFLAIFMAGSLLNLWPEPIAERLVFAVVFGWTIISASTLETDNKD